MNRTDLLNMFFVGTGVGIASAGRNPSATKRGPGCRRLARPLGNHKDARVAGIAKSLRQYAKRYGGLDVDGIKMIHRQVTQMKGARA